jgi:hypothetical protein
MPVAPKIWGVGRHDHQMPGARPDFLQAAGTQVGLDGLKRMDQADLDGPVQRGISAQSRITAITANAMITMT